MATLTIRNVPENLHERLKAEAEANRRSLNQQTIVLLEAGLEAGLEGGGKPEIHELLRRVDERRSRMKSFQSPEKIRAAINEGRK